MEAIRRFTIDNKFGNEFIITFQSTLLRLGRHLGAGAAGWRPSVVSRMIINSIINLLLPFNLLFRIALGDTWVQVRLDGDHPLSAFFSFI